ncbi:MAG: type II secretion system F family protein [Gammaproteobacteria bacterium]|nr:type II secretion system F family protein [Gammaproteobacteria bacterium]
MPDYHFAAVRPSGERLEGEHHCQSEAALVEWLQGQGYIPVTIATSAATVSPRQWLKRRSQPKVSVEQIANLTRQLSTLLEAGMPLERGLRTLTDLASEVAVRQLLQRLLAGLQQGGRFSDVLEQEPTLFSRLYVNMVRAGESGGALETVLQQLADYQERSQALKESVRSALIYPIILVTVAVLSVLMLLLFVVPQFQEMFADMGATLPLATRIVVGIGEVFRHYWWLLLATTFLLVAAASAALERPAIRLRWHAWLLRLPIAGELITKMETARFSRTLAVLLENGLPLLSSLQLAREVVGNGVIASAIAASVDDLKGGRGLSMALQQAGQIPPLALQMMRVGEESGSLGKMLLRIANVYDQEVKTAVNRALTLIEPTLIVGLGVVVAAIISSILMAILGANQLAF